ncbi:MAG: galactose-1-phosphate uridylyltransferase [candidate division Zixibacteria bacterium]|nr:galactose-1-phosphate uridylyltransferase [candidate division Zixibacteria bacterium]
MSTLRRDPIVGRWVVNSNDLKPGSSTLEILSGKDSGKKCPMCEGNEDQTPPEVYALRPNGSSPNTPGWEVRVVPNNTPAMTLDGDVNRRAELMYDMMDSIGTHEIVIGSPKHVGNMADLPEDQFTKILQAYRQRILTLKEDQRLRSVFVYKTHGKTPLQNTYPHTHSHIVAMSMTPKSIKEQYFGSRGYFKYKERCVYCDIISHELELEKRMVAQNEKFIAFTPFSSKFPYEIWILPTDHLCDFERYQVKDLPYLSSVLKGTLMRLKKLLDDPPYNFALFTGPNRKGRENVWKTIEQDYHWHIEITPTFRLPTGFEWATGFYINDPTPELAAERLRSVKV